MLVKNVFFFVTFTWLLITLSLLPGNRVVAATYTLTVDAGVRQGAIPHFWSECVGTGTMEYCLKPAWTAAARIGVQEAGFKRVRGHGILIHGNNADSIHLGANPNWNFSVIDKIYDTVIACGLKPIVELDFMPPSLQSNGANSPPNNYDAWKSLVAALVAHLETRYTAAEVRTWYFEVWNEFDYSGFWTSDAPHYYTLFDSAAAGARSVDTNIIIGGPAATNSGPLQDFWTNCNAHGIKFFSNHQYGVGTDSTALPTNIRNDNRARSDVIKNTGRNLFSLNTEFNSSYSGQGGDAIPNCMSMDNHRNAPFLAKTIKLIVGDCIGGNYRYPDVLSYWTISDCFDEWWGNNSNSYIEGNNKVPFGEVFGLINYQGIRKAAFNEYVMLNKMGTAGLQLTGGSGDAEGVDGFATLSADSSRVDVMVYSYYNNLTTTGPDDVANLVISNLPFASERQLTVDHYRIDSLHSNPYGVWRALKSPASPSAAQWDSLRAHQNLEMLEPQSTVQYTGAPITKTLTMPRWSVSLLTISQGSTEARTPGLARLGNSPFSIHGLTLIVSARAPTPVEVFVYGADGGLVKRIRSMKRTVYLGAGLAEGMYMAVAQAGAIRFTKKIAAF